MAKVIRILVYEGDEDSIISGLIARNVVNTTKQSEHSPPNHHISEYFIDHSDGLEILQKYHEISHYGLRATECPPLESFRILDFLRASEILIK